MSASILFVGLALASTPLTLEEVKQASRQQLDSIRSQLDVDRAAANSKASRSVIFPQVDLSLGLGVNVLGPQRSFAFAPVQDANGTITGFAQTPVFTDTSVQARYQLGLSINQLIYDGGRWWNQIEQSGEQETAAKGRFKEQQMASELEAVRRFYDLIKQQLALKVFVETRGRSEQQVERASALYEAGRGQRGAVYDAKTNLANDEISVVRQKQRIVQARLSLLQWLGQPDADVEAVSPAELDSAAVRFETAHAIEVARKQRPLFQSLEATVRANDLGIKVARSDYLPKVGAQAQYSRLAPTPELYVDPARQNALFAGVNVSWDLFSGFLHESNVDTARAGLTQAQAEQRQAIVNLEAEIGRTNNVYDTEVDVLQISRRAYDLAKEQVSLEEERFGAGLGSSLEVRNAQIKYTQAQLSVLQGRADVATARAALERAVGGTP